MSETPKPPTEDDDGDFFVRPTPKVVQTLVCMPKEKHEAMIAELAALRAERERMRELVNDAAGRVGRAWELTPFWRDWLEAARLEFAK